MQDRPERTVRVQFEATRLSERVMVEAYECACRQLELSGDRSDQLTELVAKKIIEIAQAEADADPQIICRQSLQELGISTH